jgi:hypothetical protein
MRERCAAGTPGKHCVQNSHEPGLRDRQPFVLQTAPAPRCVMKWANAGLKIHHPTTAASFQPSFLAGSNQSQPFSIQNGAILMRSTDVLALCNACVYAPRHRRQPRSHEPAVQRGADRHHLGSPGICRPPPHHEGPGRAVGARMSLTSSPKSPRASSL